ncbi:MAG: MerR family transcriptional regulator [Tabrizicola sp.]
MRIGELATRSGLTRDTIRFYERNGLIASSPGEDATNNYRDYSEDVLIWLTFLTGAREAGLSIADLRDIAAAVSGSCDRALGRRVLSQKLDDLSARAAQIDRAADYLRRTLETL